MRANPRHFVVDHAAADGGDVIVEATVKRGGAVLGYRGRRNRTLTGVYARAALRLRHLAELAMLRNSFGSGSPDPLAFAGLIIDAMAILHGIGSWRLAPENVRPRLPLVDERQLDDATIAGIIGEPRKQGCLMSEAEAGRHARLTVAELLALEEVGVIVAMEPFDEAPAARIRRKAERKRRVNRNKMRRWRKCQKEQRTNSVTGYGATFAEKVAKVAVPRNAAFFSYEGLQPTATFAGSTEPERIVVAIAAGASSISDIIAATALPNTTVKPLLSRLVKAGRLRRPGHGRYAIVEDAQ